MYIEKRDQIIYNAYMIVTGYENITGDKVKVVRDLLNLFFEIEEQNKKLKDAIIEFHIKRSK